MRRSVPWGVELEWRTNIPSDDHGSDERSHTYRARLEAYPALPLGSSESELPHGFGVATAGVSTGSQLLNSFDAYPGDTLPAVRPETRLELALGLHWLSLPTFVTAIVMPWITLDQGGLRAARCLECSPLEVDRIESSWGLVLALSSGVVLGPEP